MDQLKSLLHMIAICDYYFDVPPTEYLQQNKQLLGCFDNHTDLAEVYVYDYIIEGKLDSLPFFPKQHRYIL